MHSPVEAFQILAVLSFEAVSTSDPSVENIADITEPEWLLKVCLHRPVETHQILAILSDDAVSTSDPSDEKTADDTTVP